MANGRGRHGPGRGPLAEDGAEAGREEEGGRGRDKDEIGQPGARPFPGQERSHDRRGRQEPEGDEDPAEDIAAHPISP